MHWIQGAMEHVRRRGRYASSLLRLPALSHEPVESYAPDEISADPSRPERKVFQRSLSASDLETLVIGGLVPLLIAAAFPANAATKVAPLLCIAPLLLGLRYGFWEGISGGFLSAAALALATYHFNSQALGLIGMPALGLILIGMIAGEARRLWNERLTRLKHEAEQHRLRLEQFSSAYQLLKVSHTELEQRLAGNKANLRLALEQLQRRQTHLRPDASQPLQGVAQELLDIVAEQAELFTAAVYEVSERGLLRGGPVAAVGLPPLLSPFNPLLRESLRTGQVAVVSSDEAGAHEVGNDHVLAVVPLVDAAGRVHGVIGIHDMPFLQVNAETFKLLAVLGKRIGDLLTRLTKPAADDTGFQNLRDSVARHMADARQHDLDFEVVTCKVIDPAREHALLLHCCGSGRSLDESWIVRDGNKRPVVIFALALTDEAGAATFISRLQRATVQGAPARSGLLIHRWDTDEYATADDLLREIRDACEIAATGWQTSLPGPSHAEAQP